MRRPIRFSTFAKVNYVSKPPPHRAAHWCDCLSKHLQNSPASTAACPCSLTTFVHPVTSTLAAVS